MKENKFITQNKEKWIDFEDQISKKEKDPEKLTSLFLQITDDLSYSRTYYPKRAVRYYLNYLAQKIYVKLFKRRKSEENWFLSFWRDDLPKVAYECRKELALAFFVYVLAVLIGVFSCLSDPNFPNLILGESYVNTTMENIEKGDPAAIYKGSWEIETTDGTKRQLDTPLMMFFRIALNNTQIDFLTFISGIFMGLGSLLVLLYNGVMVGTFQMMFFEQGIYKDSLLAIWLHGTLEMSAMIIAGASGLVLAKGLLFPGTLTRVQSFIVSARRGAKLMLGVVPVTIIAAIIESWFTRYTHMSDLVGGAGSSGDWIIDVWRFAIIAASGGLVLWYFVLYPYFKGRTEVGTKILGLPKYIFVTMLILFILNPILGLAYLFVYVLMKGMYGNKIFNNDDLSKQVVVKDWTTSNFSTKDIYPLGSIIKELFWFLQKNIFKLLGIILVLSVIPAITLFYEHKIPLGNANWYALIIPFTIVGTYVMHLIKQEYHPGYKVDMSKVMAGGFTLMINVSLIIFLSLTHWALSFFGYLFLLAPLFIWNYYSFAENKNIFNAWSDAFSIYFGSYGRGIGIFIVYLIISGAIMLLVSSPVWEFYEGFINTTVNVFEKYRTGYVLHEYFFSVAITLAFQILIIGFSLFYYSCNEIYKAQNLKERIQALL